MHVGHVVSNVKRVPCVVVLSMILKLQVWIGSKTQKWKVLEILNILGCAISHVSTNANKINP